MNIIVRFLGSSMSFYLMSAYGTVKIGSELFDIPQHASSERREKMLKSIFKEGTEYNIERFFTVWSQIKMYRLKQWVTDEMVNDFVEKMRKELIEEVKNNDE